MMRQDINPTLSNESSSSSAAASTSGKLTLGFSGLSNAHRHIQEKALKSSFDKKIKYIFNLDSGLGYKL